MAARLFAGASRILGGRPRPEHSPAFVPPGPPEGSFPDVGLSMTAYLRWAARAALGLVFLIAGAAKLRDLHGFASTLHDFGVRSPALAGIAALLIPSAEAASGLLLIAGLWIQLASVAVVTLLALFIAAIVPLLVVGSDVPCGCFGALPGERADVGLLIRDVVLLGVGLFTYRQGGDRFSVDALLRRRS